MALAMSEVLASEGDRLALRIEGEANTYALEWHYRWFVVKALVRLLLRAK